MNAEQLKSIFESDYNREIWRNALQEIFHIQNLHSVPQPVELGANDFDATAVELGYFETAEGLQVGLYEVVITPEKRLDRNKIGLRNLMRKVYQQDGDAALIVFSQGKTWRFTYASELTVTNEETGKKEKKQTDPKRYTYILGRNQHCRTAAERFANISAQSNLFETKIPITEIEKAFSVDTLTKDFYRELSNWYFWALTKVKFPTNLEAKDETNNATSLIRLITRLIFVWFMKQKGLVPDDLFEKKEIDKLINYSDSKNSTYYKAILQNLFFATLNTPLKDDNRTFVRRQTGNQDYYRYQRFFKNKDRFLELTRDIPFLNGGLFDNLDKRIAKGDSEDEFIDCFTNHQDNESLLTIPDYLFFGGAKDVDLSESYDDDRQQHLNVRGIIDILHSYNFTVEENTPLDIQVALDPEMLGKVFENLLASYNPETKTSARKQTGSFYTPREIVTYMVDESLITYFKQKLSFKNDNTIEEIEVDEKLHMLVSYSGNGNPFDQNETKTLIEAIATIKILDPACGSGAFPMGVLQQLVHVLGKLDPENQLWRDFQINRAENDISEALREQDKEIRQLRLHDIEDAFDMNEDDYGRKLFLIENCIYGIDIQPIAVQISKLRFFISLICEQDKQFYKENFGIRSLPNLETKFVSANTLIGILSDPQIEIRTPEIVKLEKELIRIRKSHFVERDKIRKKQLRERDKQTREKILKCLREEYEHNIKGLIAKIAIERLRRETLEKGLINEKIPKYIENAKANISKIDTEIARLSSKVAQNQFHEQNLALRAAWDPYNTNVSSNFFDMDWMFGIEDGFDVVIGNPPYVSAPSMVNSYPVLRQKIIDSKKYKTLHQKWDLYIPFMELGLQLLKMNGIFSMIVPYPLSNQNYGLKLRELIIKDFCLKEIVDLNGTKVFENATVSNCIPFIQKSNPQEFCFISNVNQHGKIERVFIQSIDALVQDKKTLVWNLTPEQRDTTKHSSYNVLGDYCYISKGMVLNADENTAKGEFSKDDLISESFDKIHCRKYIEAKDIEKYRVKKVRYLEYNTKRCPGNLSRPTFKELYESPKLMFNRLGNLMVILDNEVKYLHSDSMFSAVLWKDLEGVKNKSISASIKRYSNLSRKEMVELSMGIDLHYLLGVLNSKYASTLLTNLRGGDYHIYPEHIRNIPIPKVPKHQQSPIISLVDQIISTKKSDYQTDTSTLERQIDEMVYKLYELTYEEVKVIDPDFWLSEEEYESLNLD